MATQFLTIKQAAQFLGVTPLTLRNWDKRGKLKAIRHPMSNYRIYKLEDLQNLLGEIESGKVTLRMKPKMKKRKLEVKSLGD